MIRTTKPSLRGFTLIELLVSMAIFISVITIATGALFSSQAINVRLQQTQAILDEVNLAAEVMIRDVRYGTTFYCDTSLPSTIPMVRKSCVYPNGGDVLIFRPVMMLNGSTNQLNDRVAYYISDGTLYKNEYPSGGPVTTIQMTSTGIDVTKLTFFATGAQSTTGANDFSSESDINQPLITIIVSGVTIPVKRTVAPVPFNIQTSASSRGIDN